MVEKCNEWDLSMAFCRTDIVKAYDLVKFPVILEAMNFHNIPPYITHTIVREWYAQRQTFRWNQVCSMPVSRGKGLPQGDPLSPLIFNAVLHYLFDKILATWRKEKWGILIGDIFTGFQDGMYVNLLGFADDLVILAKHPDDLKAMMRHMEESLKPAGLLLDPTKTEWSHCLSIEFSEVQVQRDTVMAVRRDVLNEIKELKAKMRKLQADAAVAKNHVKLRNAEGWQNETLDTLDKHEVKQAMSSLQLLQEQRRQLESQLADDVKYEPDFCFEVAFAKAKYVHPEDGMKLLGSIVTGAGKTGKEVSHRIEKAWRAFWSQKSILLNTLVDPQVRIRALEVYVSPVLLYACGTWTPTRADLDKIHRTHRQMSYKIVGSRMRPMETPTDFLSRRSDRVTNLWRSTMTTPWDLVALGRIYDWAGHVARYSEYDPGRLAAVVTKWHDSQFISYQRACSYDGRHLYRGHRRNPWRWEEHLCKYFNKSPPGTHPDWRCVAKNEVKWAHFRPKWVRWRSLKASNLLF